MCPSTARSTIKALVCLVLAAAPAGAAQRDAFTGDGRRSGPEFTDIPGGDYLLGSAPEEPGYFPHDRRRLVELSPFALTTHEITNDEFVEFLNERGGQDEQGLPWVPRHEGVVFANKGSKFTVRKGMGRKPIVSVSWAGARAYARWLSAKTGRRYELPTAAQWEAGARGGSTTTWWWGDAFEPGRVAVGTSVVDAGSHSPNAYGLYDTAGNAWEWTLDCFQVEAHKFTPRRDPAIFDEACFAPEVRGGSFRDGPEVLRSGRRLNYQRLGPNDSVGFRLAREPDKILSVVSVMQVKPKPAAPVVPGLELTLDTPPTDVPLAFMLFIPGSEVLHAEGGSTLRVSLTAGDKVTFIVKEADLGSKVERTVTIRPDKPTRVRLTGKDFRLPERGERILTGRVLLPDHSPVKGALVVLGDYPYRHETRTDENGFYRLKGTREGDHPLLIDVRGANLADAYPQVMLSHGPLNVLSRSVLKPRLGMDEVLNTTAVHDDTAGRWITIANATQGRLRNHLVIDIPGLSTYTVFWAKLPLNVCTGGGRLAAGRRDIAMECYEGQSRTVAFSAVDADGEDATVDIYASSFTEDPDPFEIDVDAGYLTHITKVNVVSFNAWVDEAAGCFNGLVQIPVNNRVKIQLSRPWTCYDDGVRAPPPQKP